MERFKRKVRHITTNITIKYIGRPFDYETCNMIANDVKSILIKERQYLFMNFSFDIQDYELNILINSFGNTINQKYIDRRKSYLPLNTIESGTKEK